MTRQPHRDERPAGSLGVLAVRPGVVWRDASVCAICGEEAHEDEDPEAREMADQWWAATRHPDGTARDRGPTGPGPFASEWEHAQFLADAEL